MRDIPAVQVGRVSRAAALCTTAAERKCSTSTVTKNQTGNRHGDASGAGTSGTGGTQEAWCGSSDAGTAFFRLCFSR